MMTRPFKMLACLLFLFSGLTVHAAQTPYDAFISYLSAIHAAEKPQDLLPYLTEDKVTRMEEIDKHDAAKELDVLRQTMTGIEFLYYETKIHGKRAAITIEGIDLTLQVPARWEIIMVEESDGWKFRTMQVSRDLNPINNEVRVWLVGQDGVEVRALLQSQTKDRVILLLEDMRTWELPVSELSEEDIAYLREREITRSEMLNAYRSELLLKAQAAGILPRGKQSLL